jgi:hypothetical protein
MTTLKYNLTINSFIALAVVAVGLLDYATGSEVRILALYFLLLALAGWVLGKFGAVMVAAFSTATWVTVLYFSGTHFSKDYMWFVNASTEGLGFLVVPLLVAKLRADITELRRG